MQTETQTVPIPIAGPVMREDDLNAILAPSAPEPAGLTLSDILSESRRNVPWPSGGHVTRLHTLPWEGASARYFDFSLDDRLRVRLDPDRELLLTFFLEGHVSGHVGDEHGPELDFRLNRMLLRTPNRNGGYLIDIPGASTHRFVQFRLRRDLLPRWLKTLGVRLPATQLDEMVDRDDGRILCNAAVPRNCKAAWNAYAANAATSPPSCRSSTRAPPSCCCARYRDSTTCCAPPARLRPMPPRCWRGCA